MEANLDYCAAICLASHPVHFALPWTRVFKPALTDSIALWPQRDVPRRFTCCCFQPSIRAQHDDLLLLLLLLCVYSRMVHSHERRALGALLLLVSRSDPASTDR